MTISKSSCSFNTEKKRKKNKRKTHTHLITTMIFPRKSIPSCRVLRSNCTVSNMKKFAAMLTLWTILSPLLSAISTHSYLPPLSSISANVFPMQLPTLLMATAAFPVQLPLLVATAWSTRLSSAVSQLPVKTPFALPVQMPVIMMTLTALSTLTLPASADIPKRKDGYVVGGPRGLRKPNDVYVGKGGRKLLECDYEGKLSGRISGAIFWNFAPTTAGETAGTIVRGWDQDETIGGETPRNPASPKSNEEIERERNQKYFASTPAKYVRFNETDVKLIQDEYFKGRRCGKASLYIKNFKENMQGNYSCEIWMADGTRKMQHYNLVLAELTEPNIMEMELVDGDDVVTVFEGLENTLTCDVYSVPNATITWEYEESSLPKGWTFQMEPHEYSFDMSQSLLKMKPDRYDHRKRLDCVARNEAIDTLFDDGAFGEPQRDPPRARVYLLVNYPPDEPMINFNEEQWYAEGDHLTVSCVVHEIGLPQAKLTLELPDGTSNDLMVKKLTKYEVESSMIIQPNHDGEAVACYADSDEPTLSTESEKVIKVAFGPSAVTIEGNRQVRAGENIILICTPVGTNPASEIEWFPPDYVNLPEHAQCPIGSICNQAQGRIQYEGLTMKLTAHWIDDNQTITCQATNPETWKMAEDFVKLDVTHKPVWKGTENDRIKGASLGETIVLHCNVFANPPPYRYEWSFLGPDQSKVDDPCYWEDRSDVYECSEDEDCDFKKYNFKTGRYDPYNDPCSPEITPEPVPIELNSDLPTWSLKIELDGNGEPNFGFYRCTATNDFGSEQFIIEVEDKDYARVRTLELMIIVGVASLLGLLIIVAVIVVIIVSTLRKRRLVRYATTEGSSEEDYGNNHFVDDDKIYETRLNNGMLHPYYHNQLHLQQQLQQHQQQQQRKYSENGCGNYSVVNGSVCRSENDADADADADTNPDADKNRVGMNGSASYDHDSYGNVSLNNTNSGDSGCSRGGEGSVDGGDAGSGVERSRSGAMDESSGDAAAGAVARDGSVPTDDGSASTISAQPTTV